MVEKTYPSEVLADALRERGYSVQCAWEVKPGKQAPGVAWLVCYVIHAPDGGYRSPLIVQTFTDKDGWQAWMPPPVRTVQIAETVEAVLARLEANHGTV